MVFLFGIVAISQINLAYAASSERFPLVQKLEQFPGQEVSGFCNVRQDDVGNVSWRIKVSGLAPQTQGHFDLGHWAGEDDVPYTADEDGNADSQIQKIIVSKVNSSLFSQFAKCKVYLLGNTHFTSPVIAIAELNSNYLNSDETTNQNQFEENSNENSQSVAFGPSKSSDINVNHFNQENPKEKKLFIFAALDFLFGIFNTGTDDSSRPNANFIGPIFPSNNHSSSNEHSNSIIYDVNENSNKNHTKSNSSYKGLESKSKSNEDKGNDAKPSDKGSNGQSQANQDKDDDKKPSDKGSESQSQTNQDNREDKKPSDEGSEDKGNGSKSKGNQDEGNSKKPKGEK